MAARLIWFLTLLLLAVQAEAQRPDPRIDLVRLQLEGRDREALRAVEELIANEPQFAQRAGLPYLRAHLLERLGRPLAASEAFAEAMTATEPLAEYCRFHMAVNHERLDHPEVAAGLVATVLGRSAPPPLVSQATDLLRRTLARGGDCRLLGLLEGWRLPAPERRQLRVAKAECDMATDNHTEAGREFLAVLREEDSDAIAREAAERMTRLPVSLTSGAEVSLILGMTFHHHREFDRSIHFLEVGLSARPPPGNGDRAGFEHRYAFARSHFWLGRYEEAAAAFAALAEGDQRPALRAQALYQRGRSLELAGDWGEAARSFLDSYNAEPASRWAPAALLSALRIEWRLGHEAAAFDLLDRLGSRSRWRPMLSRASLFLAASDLVRGRSDRSRPWLEAARAESQLEADYWRGRMAELEGEAARAVRHYLDVLAQDPYHPLASSARERLAATALENTVADESRRLLASPRSADLYRAWLLLGTEDPAGAQARETLTATIAAGPGRVFVELEPVPPEAWPLWRATLRQPEELLLALGIWQEGTPAMLRHFPLSNPALAFTASRLLALAGNVPRSLYVAESLSKRVPPEVPPGLLAPALRRLLYPLPFGELIREAAEERQVDPFLLAAIIREESRFDPRALSPASARGLTQFVFPTARRLALQTDLGEISPSDLDQPAISIALGAAYLAELQESFDNHAPMVLAAYNAGEDQARLWRSYCYSRDPAEYFSKVGFSETKNYLRKVLQSRAHYRELLGP